MYTEGIAIITVILFAVICLAGLITGVYGAIYMHKTMINYRPNRSWGQYLPISIFMPYFFTEEGNKYRIKLLKNVGLFILLASCGFGVGFINESLRPHHSINNEVQSNDNITSNQPLQSDAHEM